MTRGPSAFNVFLDQFQRQFYQAVHVGKLNLVEFEEAMDGVFEGLKRISSVTIKVNADQWRQRKRQWEKDWDVMNGGPSMKILRGLESQPIWFHVGPNKSIIYRPFEVDNDALSTLPAVLGIATDVNGPKNGLIVDGGMDSYRNNYLATGTPLFGTTTEGLNAFPNVTNLCRGDMVPHEVHFSRARPFDCPHLLPDVRSVPLHESIGYGYCSDTVPGDVEVPERYNASVRPPDSELALALGQLSSYQALETTGN